MFEQNTNPFLQLFAPLNGTGFLGSTTQARTPFDVNTIMPTVQSAMTGLTGVGANAGKAAADLAGTATKGASAFSTAVPFIGLGLTAVSTLMSMSEAGKAADAQRAAERAAEQAAAEQKRLLQQNFYEALRVPTEAYDRAFREGTAANTQAVEALRQDPRTLLGGIQGVQEATIEGQAKSREALADRLFNLETMKAGAATQQAQNLAALSGEEVKGAQIAAMAAEKAKIAQQQAAMGGVGNLITQGAGMVGTYGGFAKPEDKLALANLKSNIGGTSFTNQNANMLQTLSQNPDMLKQLLQIYAAQQG